MPKLLTYVPGHPLREGLRSALRGRGTTSVQVDFQAAPDGYRLRSYRLAPANVPLPADLADRLQTLGQATVNGSLPRETLHRRKRGRLTWTLGNDRIEIGY